MLKLYIFRHELAVDREQASGLDRDRTLTPEGEKNAAASGRGMARLGIKPDVILTSPYPRAAQTARLAAAQLGLEDAVVETDVLAPGADLGEVAKLVDEQSEGGSVMVVGHNPDLERLLAWLVSSHEDAAINLKKGALALIQAEQPLERGCGSLRWLLIPPHMARLGGKN